MKAQCEIVKEQKVVVSDVRELYKNTHNNKKRECEVIDNMLQSPMAKKKAKHFVDHIFLFADQVAAGKILHADSARQALAAASGAVEAATQTDAVEAATQTDAVEAATQTDAVDAVDAATQAGAVTDILDVDQDILDLLVDEEWMC